MTEHFLNPFVYNSPVLGDDFFNREETIDRIIAETLLGKTQGDVWITGERKTGKTSLLRYLYFNYDKFVPDKINIYGSSRKFKPVFTFANVQYCTTEADFFSELWQSVKNSLDFKMPYVRNNSEANFVNAIRYAYNEGFYIVFLIDEFDAFLESLAMEDVKIVRNFINKLNSYMKNFLDFETKAFSCVFASNQDFSDLNKKYSLNITGSGLIVEVIDLSWFSKRQLEELANSYLRNYPIKLTAQEISDVYRFTEGYPYFTQKLLHYIFDYKVKNQRNITTKEIKEKIAEIYEQSIRLWEGQNLQPRTAEKLYKVLGNLGEKIFDAALTILAKYVEKQMGL